MELQDLLIVCSGQPCLLSKRVKNINWCFFIKRQPLWKVCKVIYECRFIQPSIFSLSNSESRWRFIYKNSSVNPSYTVCALFYRHVQFICITKGTHYGPDMYYQTILLHQDKPDYWAVHITLIIILVGFSGWDIKQRKLPLSSEDNHVK